MIVPMKKIHMIVQKKDAVPALESLRELGSVHVEHQETLSGSQLEKKKEEVESLENVINAIKKIKGKEDVPQKEASDWGRIVHEVLGLSTESERSTENIAKLEIQIRKWELWGDFNPKTIEELSSQGVYVQLCSVPQGKEKGIPEGVILEPIFSSGGVDRCLAISREKKDLPFEVIKLPPAGLEEMNTQKKQEQEKVEQIAGKISNYGCYLEFLEKKLQEQLEILRFEEVQKGMHVEGELSVLKGFCPVEACRHIEEKAKKEHWGILFEDPSEEDHVPTLLSNPKWVEWIMPVFQFIDTLPGYKEKDVSFFFLLFFSIFFGMLIGDAAYGLVYFILTAIAHKKWGPQVKDQAVFSLLYVLSGMTILWGVLTGTFMGQSLFPTIFQPLVPWLDNAENVQRVCFILGATQLSIAHGWRAILKAPHLSFLSEIGWIMILWGMFFLAGMLVLSDIMPGFVQWLFVGGGFLVLFFTKPSVNPFKALGVDFVSIILSTINCFADLVSYIRLFAVGLATVSVADAFNELALSVGFGSIFAGLFTSIILVFGHTLNIVLGLMSVLVHGLRLNLLEFGTHLEMEWVGFRYNPFKKKI